MFEVGQLRACFGDHRGVVARLELSCRDQDAAPGLGDGVDELVGAVGRVEVDEDRPDRRGGELEVDPFDVVRAPHPDPVAGLDAEGEQSASDPVDLFGELPVGEPHVLEGSDERVAVGVGGDDPVEHGRDRVGEQRNIDRAEHVGRAGHRRAPSVRVSRRVVMGIDDRGRASQTLAGRCR